MDSDAIQRVLELRLDAEVRVVPDGNRAFAKQVDFSYEVLMGEDRRILVVEAKAAVGKAADRLAESQHARRAASPDVVPVVAASRLSAAERADLRAHGVNHMDVRGNIWIRHPGLYVNVEGKLPKTPSRRRRPGPNPFSKKASLVARVLLEDPSRNWGVRELSTEASLSVGYASDVLGRLEDKGYARLEEGRYQLADAAALLRQWCARYRWEDNETYSFVASFEKQELVRAAVAALERAGQEPALTLLSALDRVVPYVSHEQVHMYVADFPPELEEAVREELYAEPVSQGGNLHIQLPYYGEAAFHGCRRAGGVRLVSNVQLFLDLVHYPLRGPEASAVLLRRALGPQLGLTEDAEASLREALGL
jgi:DNA-binding MarR family transcriptional regulator